MTRDFRFGIGLRSIKSADRLREKVRKFEDLGFDVVHFPDHIGAPAPFPAMVAAAAIQGKVSDVRALLQS